jgi:hypothetical protein
MPAAFSMAVGVRRRTANFGVIYERKEIDRKRVKVTINGTARRALRQEAPRPTSHDESKSTGTCGSCRGVVPADSEIRKGGQPHKRALLFQIAAALKVGVMYFYEELPGGAKNSKEIKTPTLIKMSLATHGPQMMDAFLNLKSNRLRGAVADLAQALVREG